MPPVVKPLDILQRGNQLRDLRTRPSHESATIPAGDNGPTFYNSVQPDRTPGRTSHLSPTKYRIIDQNTIHLRVLVGLDNGALDTFPLAKRLPTLAGAVPRCPDLPEDKRDAEGLALRLGKRRVRARARIGRGQDRAERRRVRALRERRPELRIERRRDFGRLQEQAERRWRLARGGCRRHLVSWSAGVVVVEGKVVKHPLKGFSF